MEILMNEKVRKVIELQIIINTQIEILGKADEEKANQLETLVDNLTAREMDSVIYFFD